MTEFTASEAMLEFTSVPVRTSLADVYRGVEFAEIPLRDVPDWHPGMP